MTFGQLFKVMNPDVVVRKNGTCIWLYFDDVNYYTIGAEWWDKEIPDNAIAILREHEAEGRKNWIADREKVIKGLECCSRVSWLCPTVACPYFGKGHEFGCSFQLKRDALQLLKEQGPRVMTLEEVKGMKRLTICAVEQRSKVIKNAFNAEYGGIVTLGNENFLDFGLYGDTNRYRRTEAGYGKTWRCWTSRPTDEQREAVKWDEN